jgi:uncharacterized membrane protein YfcA
MLTLIWLLPLGFAVGTLGTLMGAGGGFILVPVLLLLFPRMAPETVTSISLSVVFFNALSGSVAYARMKRIDYKSGLMFAAVAVPGSVLGAWTTHWISRTLFDGLFGAILITLSVFLFFKSRATRKTDRTDDGDAARRGPRMNRQIIDFERITYLFSYNPALGLLVSALIGFLSSFLGIGGGIFHVPLLATVLNFPVHIATATSHFVLALMTFSGTLVHLADGSLAASLQTIAGLGAGVVAGAQWGARLSNKVEGAWIIRVLAVTLSLVGLRLLASVF